MSLRREIEELLDLAQQSTEVGRKAAEMADRGAGPAGAELEDYLGLLLAMVNALSNAVLRIASEIDETRPSGPIGDPDDKPPGL